MLVRLLVKEGAEVKVIMTPSATDFITPLTLSTLSKNPVITEYYDRKTGQWNNHVELGLWADALVIAPASANTLAKMAVGMVDNALLAVYLSARCPVFFAPAMDLDMWKHQATTDNVKKLISFGHKMIAPSTGELASGLTGEGRMAEPEEIVKILQDFFLTGLPLKGKKALVTAGPTYEAIDPVRFIGNRSSGKMGFSIARELSRKGAEVTLISGPSSQVLNDDSIKRIDVESADEMYKSCMEYFSSSDMVVMSAAVADYRPAEVHPSKVKKSDAALTVSLAPTTDILKSMGEQKKKGQLLVGFALETDNEIAHAKDKMKRKNLDMIVLNSLKDEGAGFQNDTNKITVLLSSGEMHPYELKDKNAVASDIVNEIMNLIR